MEHIIEEHVLEYPEAYKGEVVLHCMSCNDWVSLKDHLHVILEFRDSPCPGPRQHDDDDKDEILPTTSGSPIVDAEKQAALEEELSRHPDDYSRSAFGDSFYNHSDFKKSNE